MAVTVKCVLNVIMMTVSGLGRKLTKAGSMLSKGSPPTGNSWPLGASLGRIQHQVPAGLVSSLDGDHFHFLRALLGARNRRKVLCALLWGTFALSRLLGDTT